MNKNFLILGESENGYVLMNEESINKHTLFIGNLNSYNVKMNYLINIINEKEKNKDLVLFLDNKMEDFGELIYATGKSAKINTKYIPLLSEKYGLNPFKYELHDCLFIFENLINDELTDIPTMMKESSLNVMKSFIKLIYANYDSDLKSIKTFYEQLIDCEKLELECMKDICKYETNKSLINEYKRKETLYEHSQPLRLLIEDLFKNNPFLFATNDAILDNFNETNENKSNVTIYETFFDNKSMTDTAKKIMMNSYFILNQKTKKQKYCYISFTDSIIKTIGKMITVSRSSNMVFSLCVNFYSINKNNEDYKVIFYNAHNQFLFEYNISGDNSIINHLYDDDLVVKKLFLDRNVSYYYTHLQLKYKTIVQKGLFKFYQIDGELYDFLRTRAKRYRKEWENEFGRKLP